MKDLKAFQNRVSLLRALTWAAVGMGAGGVLVALLVLGGGLRFYRWPLNPQSIAFEALAGVLVGALVGAALSFRVRPKDEQIAQSIDKRARTEDKVTSALFVNRLGEQNEIDAGVARDGQASLAALEPKKVYPFKLKSVHAFAAAGCVVPFVAFFALRVPDLINPRAGAEKEALSQKAAVVEHLADEVQKELSDDDKEKKKALVSSMRKLAEDLRDQQVDKREALKRATAIQKMAAEFPLKKIDQVDKAEQKSEDALKKMDAEKDAQLQAAGQTPLTEGQKEAAKMSDAERTQKANDLQAKADQAQREAEALQRKLMQNNLTDQQRKEIQDALKDKLDTLQKLRDAIKDLKLSPEALAMFAKLNEDPAMDEIRQMMSKLKVNTDSLKKGLEDQTLTQEDIEKYKEAIKEKLAAMEELAKKLKDPEQRKAFLESLKEYAAQLKELTLCNCSGLGLGLNLGLSFGIGGAPGNSADKQLYDNGHVNRFDKPQESKGETEQQATRGDRQDKGDEQYIEVKGLATLDKRSSEAEKAIPLASTRKAEQAISHGTVPPAQLERVKKYFETLGNQN